jgi:hypothetical protein
MIILFGLAPLSPASGFPVSRGQQGVVKCLNKPKCTGTKTNKMPPATEPGADG